jgi:hypothetical protein
MSILKFDIDVQGLVENLGEVKEQVKADIQKGAEDLADMTYSKVKDLAKQKLSSLEDMYTEQLEILHPMEGLHIITLHEPALWIEEVLWKSFLMVNLERPTRRVKNTQ